MSPHREAPAGSVRLPAPEAVTLVDGLSFALSDQQGDMGPGPLGLIVRDTRHISRLGVRLGGAPAHHLVTAQMSPASARFHGYATADGIGPDAPLEIERHRTVVADGMDERITVRLWGAEATAAVLEVTLGCDFADIFEVRGMRLGGDTDGHEAAARHTRSGVEFSDPDGALGTVVAADPPPDEAAGGAMAWSFDLEPGGARTVQVSVRAVGGGEPHPRLGVPRMREGEPVVVRTDPPALGRACRRGLADRDALVIPDVLDPRRRLLAAGIPWFVALFGRDSLIAGHQARAFDPVALLDTLHALAARQGTHDDPGNDEEPGKILHEVRLTRRQWLGSGTEAGARPYYGSVDATPLFLILLGEARRWGLPRAALEPLLPAAWRALEWIRGPGDPDGDGLLEYAPRGSRSLANQSWKDSENAVQFPDGSLARGPIAMVEVQGYAYRARIELAGMLAWLGDDAAAGDLRDEAARTRALVRERFWVAGEGGAPGMFALALDGDKRPVGSEASNMGHLLWCDIPSPEEARQVGAHLAGPALASGWGLRTLSSAMAGFNPISYHAGSVWPHDTAIACEGLRRYGLDTECLVLAEGLIAATAEFGGRLPELFGGHRRDEGDVPIPYPNACRPQAWAAGVPLSLATTLLGLEPDIPAGRIVIDPLLPSTLRSLEVHGLRFPGGALSIDLDGRGPRLRAVPAGCVVELRPR